MSLSVVNFSGVDLDWYSGEMFLGTETSGMRGIYRDGNSGKYWRANAPSRIGNSCGYSDSPSGDLDRYIKPANTTALCPNDVVGSNYCFYASGIEYTAAVTTTVIYELNYSSGSGGSVSINRNGYNSICSIGASTYYWPSPYTRTHTNRNIIVTATPDAGYGFVMWSGDGVTSNTRELNVTTGDVNFGEAVFGRLFSVMFSANSGSGSMPNQSFTEGSSKNLTLNTFTRSGYVFDGWNTSSDGSGVSYANGADGNGILTAVSGSAGDTVTLYAQWRYVNFDITVNKQSTDAISVPLTIGTLKLYSSADDYTTPVSTETNGVLSYSGAVGAQFKLVCEMNAATDDFKWTANGIQSGSGSSIVYEVEYNFTPTEGQSLTKNYYFTKKALYSIALQCSPNTCTAEITSPAVPDESIGGDRYCEGRNIEVTTTPVAGFKLSSVVFPGTSGEIIEPETNVFTIPSISRDLSVLMNFTAIPYEVGADIDAPSETAITSVSVTKNGQPVETAEYGDDLVFTAVVANGYSFEGWYSGNERVSESAVYNCNDITGPVSLVAKAKVSVVLRISHRDNREIQEPAAENTCSLAVNSTAYVAGTSFFVTLGQSFSYGIIFGKIYTGATSDWLFNAWFATSDTQKTNPLAYQASGSISPTSALDITAEVTSSVIENEVTVVLKNEETSSVIDPTGLNAISVSPSATSTSTSSSGISFIFTGTVSERMTAVDEIEVGSDTLAFSGFKTSDGTLITENTQCDILVNGDRTIHAYYGSTGQRTTTLAYGLGDRTMGTFAIDGISNESGSATVSKTANRGTYVNIVAKPKNGYKFMGWYLNVPIIGDPYETSTDFRMRVNTQRTLYAYFAQDPNAIYEWEGGVWNKMLEWRSKLYVSQKPFSPSACRVDTEGYPVGKLRVEMYSSPDTSPTSVTELTNVESQTARRLPIRRMERYIRVCVQNDKEVDAVFVGTSMGGLAV